MAAATPAPVDKPEVKSSGCQEGWKPRRWQRQLHAAGFADTDTHSFIGLR